MHSFTITNEPLLNAYAILPRFVERAKEHCEYYREVAARYKSVIERHLDVEFITTDPEVTVETNQYAKLNVSVSLFCPTADAQDLEQKICADWMALWYQELDKKNIKPVVAG